MYIWNLQELTLHGFQKNKSDLILRAELPDYFQWSCNQLNLELPDRHGITLESFDEVEGENQNDIKMICN